MISQQISAKDFYALYQKDLSALEIVDVREQDEFDLIRIKGSKLLPLRKVIDGLEGIDFTKDVVFCCRTGSRSHYVGQLIRQKVLDLEGGVRELYRQYPEILVVGDPSALTSYFNIGHYA